MLQESYSLDQVDDHRDELIDIRLKWFINIFDLDDSNWPLDCVALLEKMVARQLIPFFYGFYDLPNKYDAITAFVPEHNVYILQINKKKVNYPFTHSRDRRLNFTIAHEIGHILLDHLKVSRDLKTKRDLYLEELEANEFAGRLLLPTKLLYSTNFYSLDSVATHFLVSKTALWMRLNSTKNLRLLHSKKVRCCSLCGNKQFSTFAEYCGVCGQELRNNLRGIRVIHYLEITPMDKYKRALHCPRCGSSGGGQSDHCKFCNALLLNYCSSYFTDKANECSYANPGNCRFCEMCGRPTYFYSEAFLHDWN